MKTQHTPGPWVMREDVEELQIAGAGGRGNPVAEVIVWGDIHQYSKAKQEKLWAEIEANARLIAAAPTMLLALETALRHAREAMPADQRQDFDSGRRGPSWMFAVRAAIAMATAK